MTMRRIWSRLVLLGALLWSGSAAATVVSVTDSSGVIWQVEDRLNPLGGKKDIWFWNSEGLEGWIAANGPAGEDLYPSVVLNATTDRPFVVWSRQEANGRFSLAISLWDGFGWSGAEILHRKDGADILYPQAIADRQSRIHVVWVASTGTEQPAYYGRRETDGKFLEVAIFSEPGDLAAFPGIRLFDDVDAQLLTYVVVNQPNSESGTITLGAKVKVRIADADPY
jgi:hypothetical protein